MALLSSDNVRCVTVANMVTKSEDSVNEERDLQPVLIKVLQIAASATKCACTVVDTHKSSNQFIAPVARPDGALIASGDIALWTQVVILFEFKVKAGKTDLETMFGQQIKRCRFVLENNTARQMVVAVNVTMTTLEVMTVE